MRTRSKAVLPLPRYVMPENVEIGDTIRVAYPAVNGIKKTMEGTVAARDYSGSVRMLMTAQNAVILVYGPSVPHRTVTLLARRNAEQTQLEGIEL
ncbi:MAG TPA: hypothetical protein VN039_12905 [Nitrospira sp.]|nr:hypothetical protein [Nitrospira sp.]